MQTFTGTEYLYIDIANQFGLDKKTWEDRLKWVATHSNDPQNLMKVIGQADNPILFLKAVQTLIDTQAGKWTGFIMGLDATASGLQIMAALTGCAATAYNVNLIDAGVRQDIYQKVSDSMNQFPMVSTTRKIVKKPVMTTFYGSREQPKQVFGEDTPELRAFYDVLTVELPGAMELMHDLQSCWNPNTLAHEWTMPDGHEVVAKILQPVDKRLEIDELAHSTFTHRAYINAPSTYGLSLAANIIHAFDGWIVREMVRHADKAHVQIATIHDSFWAHPNDMNFVRYAYKEILAEIADHNHLQNILRQVTGNPALVYQKTSTTLGQAIRGSEYALS